MLTVKKWFQVMVLATAALLVLGACAPGAAPPTPTPAKKPTTKVVFGCMDVFTSRFVMPTFVGVQKGWFAEEGLDIEFVHMASAGDVFRAIEGGQINYTITSLGGSANAILQGAKNKVVAFNQGKGATSGYVVKPDSPIKSYKDIKGKTIAFASPGGYTHWVALATVRAAGLKPDEVKLLPAGGSPEAWAAVMAGAADASHATDGTGTIMVMQGKARWGWKDTDVIPDLPGSIVYISEKEINERPELLKALLRAHQRAEEFVANNIDEALVLWTSHPGVAQAGMTLEIARKMNEIYPAPKEGWSTKFTVEGLRTAGDLMLETGVVKEKVPWDKVIDQRFLREDLPRVDLSKM